MAKEPSRRLITIQAKQHCPLCREKVHTQEVLTVCPGCRAVYHRECIGELGGNRCTTLGCRFSVRRRAPQAPPEGAPSRPPSSISSEAIVKVALVLGVFFSFLFLAALGSRSIGVSDTGRNPRTDRRRQQVRATYRSKAKRLLAIARAERPPASWRFTRQAYHTAAPNPTAAVLSWSQLSDPSLPSPYEAHYPNDFRQGLFLCNLNSGEFSGLLDGAIARSARVRYVIVLEVVAVRRAERARLTKSSVILIPTSRSFSLDKARQEDRIPGGFPLHTPAVVALRAYLFDLSSSPQYKGALTVTEKSPKDFDAVRNSPDSGIQAELNRVEGYPLRARRRDFIPSADDAAFRAALDAVREVLDPYAPR
ncbi:MAG: hypothetical protein JKY65_00145 [Planctomycetes bacterium]|nr:hypothetical protein [Planctomycetota bacterium]